MTEPHDVFDSTVLRQYETPVYTTARVKLEDAMDFLRAKFRRLDWRSPWLFLTTGGFHGSANTLDRDIAPAFDPATRPRPIVTFLLVDPPHVTTYYGNVAIGRWDDIVFLRGVVEHTLAAVAESQRDNTVDFTLKFGPGSGAGR